VNRVIFRGRVHGRPLPLGTYRLIATARGRTLATVTLVVVASRPTARELAAARTADVCAMTSTTLLSALSAARGPVGTTSVVSTGPQVSTGGSGDASAAAGAPSHATFPGGQVLGTEFTRTAKGFDASRALLLVAAVLAIVLLGLAALPEGVLTEPRLAILVETRRVELALAGATTLLVAVLVYLAKGW
jgi:hypothetical protein